MSRLAAALTLVAALSTAASSQAGPNNCGRLGSRCWSHCRDATLLTKNWPAMYVPHDIQAVNTPFTIMIANGWQMQNTLNDYHFDEQTGELNEFGRNKVRDILYTAPLEFRTVFVLRDDEPALTVKRMESARKIAMKYMPDGGIAEVVETGCEPRTMDADYLDRIERTFIETTPPPRMPPNQVESPAGI